MKSKSPKSKTTPKKKSHSKSCRSPSQNGRSPRGFGKKSSKRSLIKNPDFAKDPVEPANDNPPINDSAPWFSSLVLDVVSVLGKSNSSPVKRKRVDFDDSSDSPSKRPKIADSPEGDDDDLYFQMDDDDYYDFDDDFNDLNTTNNAHPLGFQGQQKKDFIDFMENFVASYKQSSLPRNNVAGPRRIVMLGPLPMLPFRTQPYPLGVRIVPTPIPLKARDTIILSKL